MASPLTFIAPLAEGIDLQTLHVSLGQLQPQLDAALTAVGTVHYARILLLDRSSPNLQPAGVTGPFSLAVVTSYDGDFDVYIQEFVSQVGAIFDALLPFTADGRELVPVADHVKAFRDYIDAHDASRRPPNAEFPFYSAYPDTVQQVRRYSSS